jgi:hypothetical protein
MTDFDARIDVFIEGLRFSRFAAWVVPKLMKEFNWSKYQAVVEWERHRERKGE